MITLMYVTSPHFKLLWVVMHTQHVMFLIQNAYNRTYTETIMTDEYYNQKAEIMIAYAFQILKWTHNHTPYFYVDVITYSCTKPTWNVSTPWYQYSHFMASGYNNGSLDGLSMCCVFVPNLLILLGYTGWYLWYFFFVSNFSVCKNSTVLYHYFSPHNQRHIIAFISTIYPVHRFSHEIQYIFRQIWSISHLMMAWFSVWTEPK